MARCDVTYEVTITYEDDEAPIFETAEIKGVIMQELVPESGIKVEGIQVVQL